MTNSKCQEVLRGPIRYGNWTEWGTNQGVIERLVLKSDEQAAARS